jgi:exodeoxyribonuclease VII, large subunit
MEKCISVSELTHYIKESLERTFRAVCIQGEISNLKLQTSGHLYFTLKDENAQISCVMFRMNVMKLKNMPKEGDKVILKGEITVYPPRGAYQLIVKELEFAGVGELLLKFQKLKEKLGALGWFDKAHKKELPKFPKTIGVVTSPTGAVIRDIIHVLERRFGNFHLILNPVKVQGEGAAVEIARAIDEFNRYKLADILIVGRGGGSFEDLFPFSEEIVAKAIFESKIPIISAVGHETDYSIADFVADIRAPTPSAAAEIALGEKAQVLDFLKKTKYTLHRFLHLRIETLKEKLFRMANHPFLKDPYAILGLRLQRLDDLKSQLDRSMSSQIREKRVLIEGYGKRLRSMNPSLVISHHKQQLGRLALQLDQGIVKLLQYRKRDLVGLVNHLKSVDPKNLLKKGYSILFEEKNGSVITNASDLKIGTRVVARLSDGSATLLVEEKQLSER